MSGRGRLFAVILIVIGTIGTLWASGSAGTAQTIEGRWSLYERANNTDFVAGTTRIDAPGSSSGYEIVGLGAVGVNESLADYHYAGPDFTPPMPSIVSCGANFTLTDMNLSVSGAYPYAGCLFFTGVTNSSTAGNLAVELGPLSDDIPVTCVGGPCQRSDLDVLAGGRTPAEVQQYCRIYGSGPGGVTNTTGLQYDISPGYTFVCPLFVIVLQPACENCNYEFEVTREVPTSTQPPLLVESTSTATGTPPTATPSNTPLPPTNTPTPVPPTVTGSPTATNTVLDEAEGVRTPGAGSTPGASITPAPPDTGTGVVVRYQQDEPPSILAIFLILVGVMLCLATAWPAGRQSPMSPLLAEVAGSPVGLRSAGFLRRAKSIIRRTRS